MTLRAKNGRWEYRFQLPGEPRVTKLTDLAATDENRPRAEKLERAHRDSILKGQAAARKPRKATFSEAADEFLGWCRVNHIPSTARRVATSLASLRVHFAGKVLASIRPADVERYKTWRLSEHRVQPITLRHDLDNLSKLFRWATKMDLCAGNPVATVEKPSSEAERIYVVSPAEEARYFAAAERWPDLRDVAKLILLQGMRPDEVMTLRKDAVDLAAGTLRVIQGKTKAARRTLRLRAESRSILAARMAAPGPWIFPSPRRAGRPLTKLNASHDLCCAEAGLAFVLYDLRHTFATRAAQAGMDLATLAAILGHAGLRCVTKYIHVQADHQFGAMERLDVAQPLPDQPRHHGRAN